MIRRDFLTKIPIASFALCITDCAKADGGPNGWPVPEAQFLEIPKLRMGINLSGVNDYANGFPFVNLMWGARAWITANISGSGAFDTKCQEFFEYDECGYPLEVPIMCKKTNTYQIIFTILPNTLKEGNYNIYYDGEGEFGSGMNTKILRREKGKITIFMKHDHRTIEVVKILKSKRGNHIRNIRIIGEGVDKNDIIANPFRREFLDFCRPFHVIRFMDWGETNASIEEKWRNRRRQGFYTWVGGGGDIDGYFGKPMNDFKLNYSGGVPYELMIDLCNRLNINPWVCIPHRADEDYIYNMSELFRTKLSKNLKIYVEYSNELWNWQFIQAHYVLRSVLAGAALEAEGLKAWDSKDGKIVGANFPERIGALASHALNLWNRGWVANHEQQRVIRVGAVQAAWYDVAHRVVQWCMKRRAIDAVSPAGYFGPDAAIYRKWDVLGDKLTAFDVMSDMDKVISSIGPESSQVRIAWLAKINKLDLVIYEGGQHIQPEKQQEKPYNKALRDAQFSMDMYKAYIHNFRIHQMMGCNLFCNFSSIGIQGTRYGSWGIKEDYFSNRDHSPKFAAIIDCNINR